MTGKIDWAAKLTSRKFWLALIGFVTPLCLAFGMSEEAAAQVAALVMSGATLIGYIIGEGLVDADRAAAGSLLVEDWTLDDADEGGE